MANQIKMATSASIIELYVRGWSQRRIARELGLDRETVSRHIRLHAETDVSKPANVPAGDERDGDSKPAIPPAGIRGRKSQCRAYHEAILAGVEAGLTAQRIFQDLRAERGFEGAYDAVKRYVRRLSGGNAERIERMECAPGEEAQVDFGLGAPVLVDGKRRRTWVLRVVLSHSRKGYSEAVFRQGTEEFVRGLENAFRYFGGVPKTLVIDNLRAAVTRADWFEPELTPKMAAFARHCGTVVLPTRPRHPEHKGKVERGVGYVKGNGLKGRVFGSLAEENAHLRQWEDAGHHDSTQAQALCAGLKAGDVCLADRAYTDFGFLDGLRARGILFVVRQKKNMRLKRVKSLRKSPDASIMSDELVKPVLARTKELYPAPLRRVTARVEVDGRMKVMVFLTNNLEWSARTVAELYRARWAVELFFKELKQTCQIRDFVGYNENAVKWQVWTGMLAHLLLRFMRHVSGWDLSFSRLAGVARAAVWVKRDLVAILKTYGTAPRPKPGESREKPPPLQVFFDFWRFDYGTAGP